METMRSPWAGRFIGLTFVLGGVAWAILTILVLGNVLAGVGNFTLGPAPSRIVAGGGGGRWFSLGGPPYRRLAGRGPGFSGPLFPHNQRGGGAPLPRWGSTRGRGHL